MSKSSKSPSRPSKPRPDFPLFVHDAKHPERARWAKKVKGEFVYFGKIKNDPNGEQALEKWLADKDDLLAGRVPRSKIEALTVESLANQFLDAKKVRLANGELAQRTWDDYRQLLRLVCDTLGRNTVAADIAPKDWERLRTVFSKRWGPCRLANAIVYTKGVWKWGWENGMLTAPMRFGSGFKRPTAKTMRANKNARGDRTFTPEEVHAILNVASPNMKAALLLGLNCGYGSGDIAGLPLAALDLVAGWAEFPRSKTAVKRRCPLWLETIQAVSEALDNRPTPKAGCERLVFLRTGSKCRGTSYRGSGSTKLALEFAQACKGAGVMDKTFYDARRTFQTVAETSQDFPAVSAVMGHVASGQDMSSIYRQRIGDDRLQAVVAVVRSWLFGRKDGDGDGQEDQGQAQNTPPAWGRGQEDRKTDDRPRLRVVG